MMGALTLAAALLQTAAIQWDALAPLPYRAPPLVTPEMQAFVERQVLTNRCPLATPGSVTVDVAVLVDDANGIRVTVPRAIRCPTVEQYASALVAGFARNNLLPRPGGGEQWYRTSITFTWGK